MSKRLYIHTNTAPPTGYTRSPNKTGLDLRKLDAVLEVMVAIRLAHSLGDRPPGAWG
jgi:sugar diacid utilization regulator